ncbi:sulfate adenylyltransferase subunit CysN [Neptunicella marina]|uniref:Sulfate adenylyltransferase subunit 1 n=1 Tax=Neptunicella marina TaxID=2125989 RepID=A0A8J6IVP6_9ALTE|nr:sulfate adenylyltransferase subunit CysN [Neptunicella marina]MBC3766742.1 sulfate adenylyltransferase subunit CysN [Neptunicella marina]
MNNQNQLLQSDILSYLEQHEQKDLLRFITCGSVDDGKSTLIGRLLHDSKMIFEDQLAAITKDSKKVGTTGDKVDLALLVDGLQSEREQGITIDVAYRYFSTDKRKFIVADTPGHEQYTRNMVTGASTCDLAVILIDARSGVKTQTKRHSFLVSLLGIKHVVVAINKMDLIDYDHDAYEKIKSDYMRFADQLDFKDIHFVPMSALEGDNVVNHSDKTPWYQGKPLMQLLESVEINKDINTKDFRFPVQYVNRPNLDYRGFAGTVVSGTINQGDEIIALPSGKSSRIKSIDTFDGPLEQATPPFAVTLTLEDEIDISRGDMIVKPDNQPLLANQFKTHLVWMAEANLTPNKQYEFKFATKSLTGSVSDINYQIDVNTLEHKAATHLQLNEIAVCDIKLNQAVACDPYKQNRHTGAFIVIDRLTNGTVGAGMIMSAGENKTTDTQFSEFELEFNQLVRKHFPHWQALDISKL